MKTVLGDMYGLPLLVMNISLHSHVLGATSFTELSLKYDPHEVTAIHLVFTQTDGLIKSQMKIRPSFDYHYVGIPVFIIVWWFAGFLILTADWLSSRACKSVWIMVPRRDTGSITGSTLEVIMSIRAKAIVVRIIR